MGYCKVVHGLLQSSACVLHSRALVITKEMQGRKKTNTSCNHKLSANLKDFASSSKSSSFSASSSTDIWMDSTT